jgi:hypothetical protein
MKGKSLSYTNIFENLLSWLLSMKKKQTCPYVKASPSLRKFLNKFMNKSDLNSTNFLKG